MFNSEALTPAIIFSFLISGIGLLVAIFLAFTGKRRSPLLIQVAIPLTVIALAGTLTAYRFRNAGLWCPKLPDDIGTWKATDTPIPKETLAILGSPKANAHEYQNHFNEVVYSTMVCAGPFDNYHDPTVCVVSNGFTLTAKKILPMGEDSWRVRALIFKRNSDGNGASDGDLRIMMYYWTQTRKGNTGMAAQMGGFRDVFARMTTGYSSVIKGEQNTILRIYAVIPPDDPKGIQTQRNLNEICRATYRALKADGERRHD